MNLMLADKVAVVTGASKGIGLAVTEAGVAVVSADDVAKDVLSGSGGKTSADC